MQFLKDTLKVFVDDIRLLLVILASTTISIISCAHLIRPPTAEVTAQAPIVETKIFVQREERPEFEYVTFDVPKAGEAILRMVNGAKVGASRRERMRGAKITLNGNTVVTAKEFGKNTDVLKVRVPLLRGTNKLGANLQAKSGQRLSVRIDAPPDKIILSPVLKRVVPGRDPLKAQATVTGLGVPVPGAKVQFEIRTLGTRIEQTAETGYRGTATALIEGIKSGVGVLQATVKGSELFEKIPISVPENPPMTLVPRMSNVTVRIGSTSSLGLTLNLDKADDKGQIVNLAYAVKPDSSGVNIEMTRKLFTRSFQIIPVAGKITGLVPGLYTIVFTATSADKDKTASAEVKVRVHDKIVLSMPSALPSGFPPASESTKVTFRALVTGTPDPPDVLYIDEVSSKGNVIAKRIAELKDNGKGIDSLAGDGFYADTAEIASPRDKENNPVEGEKYFQVRAELPGKTITRSIAMVPITHLPLKARPSDPDNPGLVSDPKGLIRFFANEVMIESIPGVSASRIRSIVKEIFKEAVEIVGYIPTLNLYLVELKNNKTAEGLFQAIEELSRYEEVKAASPNIVGQTADAYTLTDERYPDGRPTQCVPPDNNSASECQYYMQTIRADDAWDFLNASGLTMTGSSMIRVAVIDNGIDTSHPDLNGQVSYSDHPASAAKDHGTPVAGLIAAKHDPVEEPDDGSAGIGIAGVAPGTKLIDLRVGQPDTWAMTAGIDAATSLETKILNISHQWSLAGSTGDYIPSSLGNVRDALASAINDHNRLVIVAAGNLPGGCPSTMAEYESLGMIYPAQLAAPSCPAWRTDCPMFTFDPGNALLAVGAIDIDSNDDGVVNSNEDIIATDMRGNCSGGTPCPASGVCSNGNACAYCSNVHPWIKIYAPGDDVVTTQLGAGMDPANGTSFATPLVSGAAAVLWATDSTGWTNETVANRLIERGRPLALAGQLHPLLDGTPPDDPSLLGTSPKAVVLNLFAAVAEPYELVFVLDRSGSMRSTTHIDTNVANDRWDALRIAATEFTRLISASDPPQSNFGLTLFAGNVLPDPLPSPGMVPIDEDLETTVIPALSQTPGGSTAMGLGLQYGMAKMTDPSKPRVVVLFTDGEQNVAPLVADDGCSFSDSTPINPTCPGGAESVKIIAVGIGNPSTRYLDTLQELANKNRGSLIITNNGTDFTGDCTDDINGIFDCAIAPALFGNSLQMVTSYKGKLSKKVTLPAFDLNKHVGRLLVKIAFSRKFELPQLVSILAGVRIMKDGNDITQFFQPDLASTPHNSILLKTNFVSQLESKTATMAPEGSYTIKITAPANMSSDLPFRVVAYADDHRLDMQWRVNPPAPRVNRPFNPTVSLRWRGKPLTTATVEAQIMIPGGDLGDSLARHPLKVDPDRKLDAGSPGYQKYLHLLKNEPKFLDKLRPQPSKLTLVHQGGGLYSASFNTGSESGIYQVIYRVSAQSAEFGKIQRKAVQSVYIRFGGINLDNSSVQTTVTINKVTIRFRPITTYGRFIGPAQGSAFTVDGAGIKLSNIVDYQNGVYDLVLTGNPDGQIAIKLLGQEIYKGPASKIGKKRRKK